jgi:hypothetical protein
VQSETGSKPFIHQDSRTFSERVKNSEKAVFGLEDRCSIQLSYGRMASQGADLGRRPFAGIGPDDTPFFR